MARILETDHYALRDAVFSDYAFFLEWENDKQMTEYISIDSDRTYEEIVTEGFSYKSNSAEADLTIVEKDTDIPLGRVIITRIDRHYMSLDITKMYIGGNRRGHGIGREVLTGLIRYLFEERNYERVTLDYYTGNKKAAALYRSIGFVDEGLARNACIKDGVYYDLNLMSMLRDDYIK